MAPRACLTIILFAGIATALKDCLEITVKNSILTDSLHNGTVLKISRNYSEIQAEKPGYNVVELLDKFPKVVVPSNGSSEQCRTDSKYYLDSLARLEIWALKSKYIFLNYFISHKITQDHSKFLTPSKNMTNNAKSRTPISITMSFYKYADHRSIPVIFTSNELATR